MTSLVDSFGGNRHCWEGMDTDGFGKVELRGAGWSAKNTGDRLLERGERCRVVRVDGLLLWVREET